MKKIISILLAALVLVTFAACSGGGEQKTENSLGSANVDESTTNLNSDGKKESVEVFIGFYVNGVKENGYDYDENGNMILDIEYMSDGVTEKERRTWQYDEDNNLLKETYDDMQDNSEASITDYSYDENGNCYLVKGPYDHREMKYDENGNCIEKISYRSGNMFSKSIYENDSQGRCILETQYNADGSLNAKIVKEYDSLGRVVCETETDSNGTQRKKIREYDEVGETKKYASYEDGVCSLEYGYIYDENGICTEYYYKGSSSHDSEIFTYDANGNRIKREIYRDGQLKNRYEYTYDSEGRVVSFTVYNSNGEFDRSEDIEYTSTGLRKKRTLNYSNRETDIVEYEYKFIEVPAQFADSVRDFQMEYDP